MLLLIMWPVEYIRYIHYYYDVDVDIIKIIRSLTVYGGYVLLYEMYNFVVNKELFQERFYELCYNLFLVKHNFLFRS